MDNQKLKAFEWVNSWDDGNPIVFTHTAGQAKAQIADEYDIDFVDINVKRLKWADRYANCAEIPIHAYLANSWWVPCSNCYDGMHTIDDIFGGDNMAYLVGDNIENLELICECCASDTKIDKEKSIEWAKKIIEMWKN